MRDGSEGRGGGARRRRRESPRRRVVKFRLNEDEYATLAEAAVRHGGWACGAYVAHTALAAAHGESSPRNELTREALTALMQATGQLHRVGVNLNQAVAKLNTTGQRSEDLAAIAAYCARVVARLDEAALDVKKRLA